MNKLVLKDVEMILRCCYKLNNLASAINFTQSILYGFPEMPQKTRCNSRQLG